MDIKKKEDILREAKDKNLRLEKVSLIYDFAAQVSKKFGSFIKAIVIFGSFARKQESKESDIDILIIVDDSFAPLDNALFLAFKSELAKLQNQYKELHINVVALSNFWDSVRRADPLTIQVLRDGIPIVDLGFFAPLKRLLLLGKIKPSEEAITAALFRAFQNINAYSSSLLTAATMLYWAAIEAAHAAIMKFGKIPGSPWDVPKLLKETLLKEKVITEEDINTYKQVFETYKAITKAEITYISAIELEALHKKVVEFVTKLDSWINLQEVKGNGRN